MCLLGSVCLLCGCWFGGCVVVVCFLVVLGFGCLVVVCCCVFVCFCVWVCGGVVVWCVGVLLVGGCVW